MKVMSPDEALHFRTNVLKFRRMVYGGALLGFAIFPVTCAIGMSRWMFFSGPQCSGMRLGCFGIHVFTLWGWQRYAWLALCVISGVLLLRYSEVFILKRSQDAC